MSRRANKNRRKLPRRAAASISNSTTSPAAIKRHTLIATALQLRLSGRTFTEIASQMAVSISTCHAMVVEGLKSIIREPAEQVLQLELRRLDQMLGAIYPRALRGDLRAVESVITLQQQRAKYLGLYAPTKSALTDGNGLPFLPLNPPQLKIVFTSDPTATVTTTILPEGPEKETLQ
jgi:hypothetical protein